MNNLMRKIRKGFEDIKKYLKQRETFLYRLGVCGYLIVFILYGIIHTDTLKDIFLETNYSEPLYNGRYGVSMDSGRVMFYFPLPYRRYFKYLYASTGEREFNINGYSFYLTYNKLAYQYMGEGNASLLDSLMIDAVGAPGLVRFYEQPYGLEKGNISAAYSNITNKILRFYEYDAIQMFYGKSCCVIIGLKTTSNNGLLINRVYDNNNYTYAGYDRKIVSDNNTLREYKWDNNWVILDYQLTENREGVIITYYDTREETVTAKTSSTLEEINALEEIYAQVKRDEHDFDLFRLSKRKQYITVNFEDYIGDILEVDKRQKFIDSNNEKNEIPMKLFNDTAMYSYTREELENMLKIKGTYIDDTKWGDADCEIYGYKGGKGTVFLIYTTTDSCLVFSEFIPK